MPSANPENILTESRKKAKFKKIIEACKTDNQKINFFNNHQEAFFDKKQELILIEENVPKYIDDAFYIYANMKRMTEFELNDLKKLSWKNYPRNFKIFLFDFCFLDSD